MGGEVAGGWRKLYNKEFYNLYDSPNMRMRWAGHVACMGEMTNTYKILFKNPEGKGPHGRRRCRWEGNIEMDLTEIRWEVLTRSISLRMGTSGEPL
jgi:hypothetical protein